LGEIKGLKVSFRKFSSIKSPAEKIIGLVTKLKIELDTYRCLKAKTML